MDDIIQRIINSDNLAQRIIDEARQEKVRHDSDLTGDIEKYQYKMYKDMWAKLNIYVESEKRKTADEVRHVEKVTQDRITNMKKQAERHKNEWINVLYGRILDRKGQNK